jgi:LPXTG-motif cell wall-anchored protein
VVAALGLAGGVAMVAVDSADDDPVASAGGSEDTPDEGASDPESADGGATRPGDDGDTEQRPDAEVSEADDDAGGASAPADDAGQPSDPDDDREIMALPETGADSILLLLGGTLAAAVGTSRRRR